MSGGTLSGNTATSNGGGVYLGNSRVTFTMNGGLIEGSSAVSGGGVYVAAGTFTMNGGSIKDSSAVSGGGVYEASGTFTMTNGTIEGNSAVSGGGVYVNAGTFTKADTDSDGDSGIIYGATTDGVTPEDVDLKNTASGGDGHAAWVVSGSKKRDTTAGTGDDLDSATEGVAGGWEE
jgi:hypothetical protein